MRVGIIGTVVLASALVACSRNDHAATDTEPHAVTRAAIIGGAVETAYRGVVLVYAFGADGSAEVCTGAVIGPHAVLTAKHCTMAEEPVGSCRWTELEPRALGITVTANVHEGSEAAFVAAEILRTSGSDVCGDIADGRDLAVLLTGARIATEHYAIEAPREGEAATMVGFGRTRAGATDPMDYGIEQRGDTTIGEVSATRVTTMGESWTCLGDSGAPLFDSAGAVVGIASFRVGDACTDELSVFVRPDAHAMLLDDAHAWEPTCEPTEPTERSCNWLDDDCDGTFDEGCTMLGGSCTADEECSSGACSSVAGGQVCTRACDPDEPEPTCPFGYACIALGPSCDTGGCVVEGTAADPTCAPDAGPPVVPEEDAASPDARVADRDDAGTIGRDAGGPATSPPREDDGGCAVVVGRTARSHLGWWVLAAIVLVATRARSRSSLSGCSRGPRSGTCRNGSLPYAPPPIRASSGIDRRGHEGSTRVRADSRASRGVW